MITNYQTIARAAEAEVEVKRSRFVAWVERVSEESQARAVVEAARRRHGAARHHCSAFVLGPDGRVARSSDDGEPPGTAGMPMLDVVRSAGVSDTVTVVSRWFGGTLLGTGGLIRAYSESVAAALIAAGRQRRALLQRLQVSLAPGDVGRVENVLRGRGLRVAGVQYAPDSALLTLDLTSGQREALPGVLGSMLGRPPMVHSLGENWIDSPEP